MSEQSSSNGMTKRFVRAAVVSAVTGAVTYGIRKAAPAVGQKLQSLGNGDVPGKEALGKAKDAVEEKVEAATSAVTDRVGGGSSGSTRPTQKLSSKDLDQRLKRRAKHRQQREKALTS